MIISIELISFTGLKKISDSSTQSSFFHRAHSIRVTFTNDDECIIYFFKKEITATESHISPGMYTALSTLKEDHAVGLNLHDGQSCQLLNGSIQDHPVNTNCYGGEGVAITCISGGSPLQTGRRNAVIIDRVHGHAVLYFITRTPRAGNT